MSAYKTLLELIGNTKNASKHKEFLIICFLHFFLLFVLVALVGSVAEWQNFLLFALVGSVAEWVKTSFLRRP